MAPSLTQSSTDTAVERASSLWSTASWCLGPGRGLPDLNWYLSSVGFFSVGPLIEPALEKVPQGMLPSRREEGNLLWGSDYVLRA